MSKRRFELVDNRSDKFWEVEVDGRNVKIRYGRNGTDGQTLTKPFDTNAQAARYAKTQIASKLKKGYAEVAIATR